MYIFNHSLLSHTILELQIVVSILWASFLHTEVQSRSKQQALHPSTCIIGAQPSRRCSSFRQLHIQTIHQFTMGLCDKKCSTHVWHILALQWDLGQCWFPSPRLAFHLGRPEPFSETFCVCSLHQVLAPGSKSELKSLRSTHWDLALFCPGNLKWWSPCAIGLSEDTCTKAVKKPLLTCPTSAFFVRLLSDNAGSWQLLCIWLCWTWTPLHWRNMTKLSWS